jgi:hypothetical protein
MLKHRPNTAQDLFRVKTGDASHFGESRLLIIANHPVFPRRHDPRGISSGGSGVRGASAVTPTSSSGCS